MSYVVGSISVLQRKTTSGDSPAANNLGGERGSTILQPGYRRNKIARSFETPTLWESNVEVPLRDGTSLRADIFRPVDDGQRVPVLLVWSPYGKSGTGE